MTNIFLCTCAVLACVDPLARGNRLGPRARVLLLRRGDPAAFGRVYEAYGPRIFRFLARMCGQKDVAEDLYQETWIKLAIHARRLEDDTDLGAWLYTVARNLARSERRTQSVRPPSEEVPWKTLPTPEGIPARTGPGK